MRLRHELHNETHAVYRSLVEVVNPRHVSHASCGQGSTDKSSPGTLGTDQVTPINRGQLGSETPLQPMP